MATLKIQSGRSFASWTFAHYIYYTEANYRRLAIIYRVLELIGEGYNDDSFKVASDSSDAFSDEELHEQDFERYVPSLGKDEDYKKFWDKIRRLDRPAVFVRKQNGFYSPVYRAWGRESLTIKNAELQSPFNITFEGIGEILDGLRFGAERNRRDRELHELNLQKENLKILKEKIKLAEKLEKLDMSSQAKEVISGHLAGIAHNQALKNAHIDGEYELIDDSETKK